MARRRREPEPEPERRPSSRARLERVCSICAEPVIGPVCEAHESARVSLVIPLSHPAAPRSPRIA